jgi:hypothetical protein
MSIFDLLSDLRIEKVFFEARAVIQGAAWDMAV